MSDRFGAIRVPLAAPAAEEAAADPCLSVSLSFLQAFLNANAVAACRAVAPAVLPVTKAYSHDPAKLHFNERELPTLFLWRAGSTSEQMADDWDVETTRLTLLWVFPTAPQETQRVRTPVMNGLAKLLNVAIERGRTPGWTVPGDPELAASEEGSLFYTFAGLMRIRLTAWKPSALVIQMSDHSPPRTYTALEATIEIAELFEDGLDRFPANDAVDLTVASSQREPSALTP